MGGLTGTRGKRAETMKIKIDKKIGNLLSHFIQIAIGCIFIYSSLPKIRYPYEFLHSVYSYEIVGPKLGMFTAMTLPWAEVLVGICLVGGIFVSGALLVSAGMGALFTFVVGSALYHGLAITCGCFGASATEVIGISTVIRAILIMIFSVLAYSWLIFKPMNE